MDNTDLLLYTLGVIVVLFLIRDVLCWFWKINKIVARLESIDSNLKIALEKQAPVQQAGSEA